MGKLQFWKRTLFWSVIKDCLTILGVPTGIVATKIEQDPTFLTISAICAIVAGILAKVFVDHDNNGVVDLFEKNKK